MVNNPFLIQDAAKLLQSMHASFLKLLELNGMGPSADYSEAEANDEDEPVEESIEPSIMDASSAWDMELAKYASGEFMECLEEEPMHIDDSTNPDDAPDAFAQGLELGIPQSVHLLGYHRQFGLLPINQGMFQDY